VEHRNVRAGRDPPRTAVIPGSVSRWTNVTANGRDRHGQTLDPMLAVHESGRIDNERIVRSMGPGITGLNHITLAVSDLEQSLAFYRDVLGCAVRALWSDGAYLEAGPLWLCLSRDEQARSSPRTDDTHIAFSVSEEDYSGLSERLLAECVIWKDNRSEGASTYFLDPDGHKLEIHMGSLETRLSHYRECPSKGVRVFDA
jgi:catechol 2,3-dioxygenase-like lactoylglutathione lyase family enzyme